jgi:hypothetical protein
VSASVDEVAHYIIALPPVGIPKKIMQIIKSMREKYGVVHTTLYQTPNSFTMRPAQNKYVKTNFWIEISNKPLTRRPTPDWPLPS